MELQVLDFKHLLPLFNVVCDIRLGKAKWNKIRNHCKNV